MATQQSDRVVLQDTFSLHDQQSQKCHVVLERTGLSYKRLSSVSDQQSNKYERLNIKDVAGCHCMRDKPNTNVNPGAPAESASSSSSSSSRRNSNVPSSSSSSSSAKSKNAYICVYAYPLKKKRLGKALIRYRSTVVFKIDSQPTQADNLAVAQRWKLAITCLVRQGQGQGQGQIGVPQQPQSQSQPQQSLDISPPNRRLLIFVNPHSGPGKALQICQQRLVPILAEADISYQLLITDRANHAKEYVRTIDMKQWDGLVIVSGDGLLFEVFNGLMERDDWESAIKIPVGVIPGGSGNGLARALGHALGEPYLNNPVLISGLNLISGRHQALDLVRVETATRTLYSFLSIGWGLMADIDIESEKLRFMGEQRFTLWALARVIGLRIYRGRVSFLPIENYVYEPNRDTKLAQMTRSKTTMSGGMGGRYSRLESESDAFSPDHEKGKGDRISLHSCGSVEKVSMSSIENNDVISALEEFGLEAHAVDVAWAAGENTANMPRNDIEEKQSSKTQEAWGCRRPTPSLLPPLSRPVPSNWTVVEGEFLLVYVAYQTHIGSDAFLAPSAHLADGIMWMVIIRSGVKRSQIVSFLLAMEKGEHVSCPYVDMIPVRALRLEPETPGGYLTVDGEQIEYSPLQAEVLPGLGSIMVR